MCKGAFSVPPGLTQNLKLLRMSRERLLTWVLFWTGAVTMPTLRRGRTVERNNREKKSPLASGKHLKRFSREEKPLRQSSFCGSFPPPSFYRRNRLLFGAAMRTPSDELKTGNKPNRRLRVVKWLGMVPIVAVCTTCAREFTAPTTTMHRAADAQKALQMKFDRHECSRK